MTKRRKPRFEVHRLTHLSYGRDRFLDAEGLNISRTGCSAAPLTRST